MLKFSVEKLPNGNFFVEVFRDDKKVVERAYEKSDLKSVVSLMVMTFDPR